MLAPPTTVIHGAPTTFTATIDDLDRDPVDHLDYVLAYGPAGMTVNPDTGVVTWTASGPMFDRSVEIGWGITIDGLAARVRDGHAADNGLDRDYPLLRFGTEIPVWPAGLSVADFDADGDTEMLVMAYRGLFELAADGAGGYRQSWAYPFSLDMVTQYLLSGRGLWRAGTCDGDDRHEIFAAVGRTLTKLDGVARRPEVTRELGASESCNDLLFTDLKVTARLKSSAWRPVTMDGDGAHPRAARQRSVDPPRVSYGRLWPLVGGRQRRWRRCTRDRDRRGYVFDGATFVNQWLDGPGFGMDVDTGDLDGNGVEEIVAAAER